MQGYTVTARLEKSIVDQLEALAETKRMPPREMAGRAIELYVSLPDDLRKLLHSLATTIAHDDTPYIMKDVVRSLHDLDSRRRHRDLTAIQHQLLP